MTKTPLFITFEGCDGSGKTTQANMLHDYFLSINHNSYLTREIGGTEVSEKIRGIVLFNDMNALTELMLSMAARNEHVLEVIKPKLQNSTHVISDRFVDSTAVYRSISNKPLTHQYVYDLHTQFFGDLWPNLTFLLDVPSEMSNKRASMRENQNKFDCLSTEKYEDIRRGFLHSAKMYPSRFHIIDGSRSPDIIHKEIIQIVQQNI